MDGQYDEFGNYIGPELVDDDADAGAGAAVGGGEEDGWGDEDGAGGSQAGSEDEGDGAAVGGAGTGGGRTDLVPHGVTSLESAVVLHEDKKYYPSAEEVYPEAETLVQEEDTQPLSKPIIAPIKAKRFSALESEIPETTYAPEFLTALMSSPALVRNVAVAGHLHHGKTSLLDRLIEHTHAVPWDPASERRYTDARRDEQARLVSIKATPVSLVLQGGSSGKSYLVNAIDTPGHVNFSDEATAAFRAVDGLVLVVDAVEGVMMNTERLLRHAVAERLAVTLVLSKVDRLLLELKLPPQDAYFKLLHTITEVNAIMASAAAALPGGAKGSAAAGGGGGKGGDAAAAALRSPAPAYRELNPAAGNVIFASAAHGWMFSLESFARVYVASAWAGTGASAAAASGSGAKHSAAVKAAASAVDPVALGKRLWGDLWYDRTARRFTRAPPPASAAAIAAGAEAGPGSTLGLAPRRSFVEFVLEPLYKVYSAVLSEDPDSPALAAVLDGIGVRLPRAALRMDAKPLLRTVFRAWLGEPSGFTDMVVRHVPSPADAGATKAAHTYTGAPASPEAAAMRACDADGPLVAQVVKLIDTPDGGGFLALTRVMSGTLRAGQAVRVLGEAYSAADEEDMSVRTVTGIAVGQARYRLGVSAAPAGSIVLLEGVDEPIAKTATLAAADDSGADVAVFKPLPFSTVAVVSVSVEPLNPSELPKVLAGLRKVQKSYPLARARVEESGEHVIVGTGELALDCIMHDLRVVYGDGLEVKVADPVTSFAETVSEASSVKCFAQSANKKNSLTMLAEPLEKGLAEDLDAGRLDPASMDRRAVSDFLQERHGWDALAARNVWGFGPTPTGPNALVDDSLAGEVDRAALRAIKDAVVQGFQWGAREGPLCDEPIRGVKWRLLDASVAPEPIMRGGGQIIPAARRAAYSAFLLASPRLMEPYYSCEILAPADAIQAIYHVLARRRGHIVHDAPKPGTPFYTVKAVLPVMDSFGFETDLRVHTQGQAFGMQVFEGWHAVPGDPLDKTILLRPLEPAPPAHLARDFMVKTRRRKGLPEDVSIARYFDDAMLAYLAAQEAEMAAASASGGAGAP